MKKCILRRGFLVLFLCVLSFAALWGQEDSSYFYYYKGSRIYLTPDYTTISVSLRNDKALKSLEEALRPNEILKHSFNYNILPFLQNAGDVSSAKKENTSIVYAEIHYSAPLNKKGYQEEESRFNKISSFLMLSIGFVTDNGHKIGLSNNFYVKLRDSSDYTKLSDLASQYNIKILGSYKYRPLWHILSCDKDSKIGSLEAANLFYESNLFSHSEPEFMGHNLLQGSASNDTYFSDQWYLKNTGQEGGVAGIDIRAEDAWCFSKVSALPTTSFLIN